MGIDTEISNIDKKDKWKGWRGGGAEALEYAGFESPMLSPYVARLQGKFQTGALA